MSVKIGIDLSRDKERKPGQVGGGIWLFELLSLRDDGSGRMIVVGTLNLRRDDLLHVRERGNRINLWVLGYLRFASDVTPALVQETIGSVTAIGKLSASPEVAAALAVH
jgi:hypothetical protein